MVKLLIVEDNPDSLRSLELILGYYKYTIFGASNGKEALDILSKDKIDCALIDLLLPDYNGWQLIDEMEKSYPEVKIIVISGYSDIEPPSKHNKVPILKKPYEIDHVLILLDRVLSCQ